MISITEDTTQQRAKSWSKEINHSLLLNGEIIYE